MRLLLVYYLVLHSVSVRCNIFQKFSSANNFLQNLISVEKENLYQLFDEYVLDTLQTLGPKSKPLLKEYDFIVVGAGSAGAPLANRLSENPEWNVLLLEAGTRMLPILEIPVLAPLPQLTPYNWKFKMELQEDISQSTVDKRMNWPRGKALGGTSCINWMLYTRGQPACYDRWASLGNPGWGYKDVLKYFMKSENATLGNGDLRFHGYGGFLSVQDTYQSKITDAFINSSLLAGYELIDYNSDKPLGVSRMQGTVSKGRRHSTDRAFLRPIEHRKNLNILTEAHVTKILIDPSTKKATGVVFKRHGIKHTVRATKEVILSAGAFQSPQLLMLSGIGPQDDLEEFKIPVIQDLPVGQYLEDHLTFPGLSFTINKKASVKMELGLTPTNLLQYLFSGTGFLTSTGGVQAISYTQTNLSTDPEGFPDLELLFVASAISADYGFMVKPGIGISDEDYYAVFGPLENIHTFSVFPTVIQPKSTGAVKLRSRNPHDAPLLFGNYFTDQNGTDLETFIRGIRIIQDLAKSEPFQIYGAKLNPRGLPRCKEYIYDSDDYWRCAVKAMSYTFSHQIGTARMGPKGDPLAVVDNELKVHGIENLRVADCSVIPRSLGAHTNAPAIMIGEKAADLIKETWTIV